MAGRSPVPDSRSDRSLTHIIHERFYCNRRSTRCKSEQRVPRLRQAWLPVFRIQAGRLAARSVDILFQVCLPSSRLRVPVSRGVLSVSLRIVMNNVG
jgi:hypothetical protein